MNEKFLKPYNPKETEKGIYEQWEKSGYFNPDNLTLLKENWRHLKPYSIIMPPPNANGHLHAGHSLFITLEDIMIRFKRMRGYKTLWIPGADHAGFETQIVYEKKLEKEGRSRFKMDPQELYKEILAFTLENKKNMEQEVRAIGASCDWSREKFTLDTDVIKQVHGTFKKMFDDGLIYRGKRIVNWCVKHQTSLSEVETESKELTDTLYYLKYGPLTVATVRPETIFGDVAVAVNPTDQRYKKYIDTEIDVTTPIGVMKLKVVGDDAVLKDFGTGALKITPAHDKNDFELAQRHNLPAVEVIDQFGKLNDKTGKYKGMKIKEAREAVAKDLQEMGLIIKTEAYAHEVPVCYKCETTIEPRIIPQWFVKMAPLAEMALKAVEQEKIAFYPDNYRKVFTHWMKNPIDWNISRQIVWGIKIPAKICDGCGFGMPVDTPTNLPRLNEQKIKCQKCGAVMRDDADTFDTWFSSGQWPLITLGFPDGKDFKTFYPTDVMETGSDLIFKWIPRMVIFGLYLAKDIPFKNVYLHGLVNDAQGKKMSKSKGNVINPIEFTDKYGTDALRMALIVGNTPGSESALSENKVKGYRNFTNKIWNIARFILTYAEETDGKADGKIAGAKITSEKDTLLFKKQEEMIKDITKDMEEYRFHLVGEKIYHYVWHTLADIIIEESKIIAQNGDNEERISRKQFLIKTLENCLKILHPFMPFVTEEIWQSMGDNSNTKNIGDAGDEKLLMVEQWP
jgi:valyl-tRNA synthetase